MFFEGPDRRSLYVSPEMSRWLAQNPSRNRRAVKTPFVRQRLGQFVRGEHVDNLYYMKRLTEFPDEIWEIRVITTSPQARIFGAFRMTDVFIGLNWAPRDWLASDRERWQRKFDDAMSQWRSLFGTSHPFTSARFDSYVSERSNHYDWDCDWN
jgi:hypothetical protein